MLGTSQRKKQGFVRGCIIPIFALIGILAGCYGLCMVLFLLNEASKNTTSLLLGFGLG
ncbi:MAG TPA: hypothetical protein VJ183_20605 [Chloroflexia bacterium]|nr:hypothetical protein [Chloroflexia bacterium]